MHHRHSHGPSHGDGTAVTTVTVTATKLVSTSQLQVAPGPACPSYHDDDPRLHWQVQVHLRVTGRLLTPRLRLGIIIMMTRMIIIMIMIMPVTVMIVHPESLLCLEVQLQVDAPTRSQLEASGR
jgi:hypothetical protein